MEEKDRLGTKLGQKERAEENRYFAQQDKALITKLKEQQEAEQEKTRREHARNRCPKCGETLTTRLIQDVEIDECPRCHGMWLDKGELEAMSEQKGNGWAKQFVDGMSRVLTGGRE